MLCVTDVVDGLLLRATTVGDSLLVSAPADDVDELRIGATVETGGLTGSAISVGAISTSVV